MVKNFIYSDLVGVYYNKRLIESIWVEEDRRIDVNFRMCGDEEVYLLASFGSDRYDDAVNYIEQNFVYG